MPRAGRSTSAPGGRAAMRRRRCVTQCSAPTSAEAKGVASVSARKTRMRTSRPSGSPCACTTTSKSSSSSAGSSTSATSSRASRAAASAAVSPCVDLAARHVVHLAVACGDHEHSPVAHERDGGDEEVGQLGHPFHPMRCIRPCRPLPGRPALPGPPRYAGSHVPIAKERADGRRRTADTPAPCSPRCTGPGCRARGPRCRSTPTPSSGPPARRSRPRRSPTSRAAPAPRRPWPRTARRSRGGRSGRACSATSPSATCRSSSSVAAGRRRSCSRRSASPRWRTPTPTSRWAAPRRPSTCRTCCRTRPPARWRRSPPRWARGSRWFQLYWSASDDLNASLAAPRRGIRLRGDRRHPRHAPARLAHARPRRSRTCRSRAGRASRSTRATRCSPSSCASASRAAAAAAPRPKVTPTLLASAFAIARSGARTPLVEGGVRDGAALTAAAGGGRDVPRRVLRPARSTWDDLAKLREWTSAAGAAEGHPASG